MQTIIDNGISWIDINNPKERDLNGIKERFHLHPFIIRQLLPSVHRPKIEEYPGQLFIVLQFPILNSDKKGVKLVELDFIITANTLITSHSGKIPALEEFFNNCKKRTYYRDQHFKSNGHLLLGLLDWLIDARLPLLDKISERIDKIEKKVFQGKEREMLSQIALVKKDLIGFRKAVKPQATVLEILEEKTPRFFNQELKPLVKEVVGSNSRVLTVLENHQELINSIDQTNNSLLSYKLSDIVKILTVVSFITFPLSVIVGFFGMNIFDNIPIVRENVYTWLVILIAMAIVTIIMVIYFKRKKWL